MSNNEKRHRGAPFRVPVKSSIRAPPKVAMKVPRPSASGHSSESGSLQSAQADPPSPTQRESESEAQPDKSDPSDAQKDVKIADLKVMESEFLAQFTELSQKLSAESEKVARWQQKHSDLTELFLKAENERRLLQQNIIAREQAYDARERDMKTRISALVLERDGLRESCEILRGGVREKDAEVQELRGQVRGLKRFVSENTRMRMEGQVTDEVVGDAMRKLGDGLQNWTVAHFRKAAIDISNVKAETRRKQMTSLVPRWEEVASTAAKVHLIQSIVSALLVWHVFDTYYFGLSETRVAQLEEMESHIRSFSSQASVNHWRSTTLGIFRKDNHALQADTDGCIQRIVEEINGVLDDLTGFTGSESRDQQLHVLVYEAVELARLIRVQKAVFSIIVPAAVDDDQEATFDGNTMEDIGGEDEEMLQGRAVLLCTFPGMMKEGDENGEGPELRNVVVKARVKVRCS